MRLTQRTHRRLAMPLQLMSLAALSTAAWLPAAETPGLTTAEVPTVQADKDGKAGARQAQAPLDLIATLVEGWRSNNFENVPADCLPAYQGHGLPVAIADLVAFDAATKPEREKLITAAEAEARKLTAQYTGIVDNLYRKRIADARELLDADDQKVLDAALVMWVGCDRAEATVKEQDPTRRYWQLMELRRTFYRKAIVDCDPVVAPRLLGGCANHVTFFLQSSELDRDLCVKLGIAYLSWPELFESLDAAGREKLSNLSATYWSDREKARTDYQAALAKTHGATRTAIIALLPEGETRDTLNKLNDWQVANGPTVFRLNVERANMSRRYTADPKQTKAEQQKAIREHTQNIKDRIDQITKLDHEYENLWPQPLQDKALILVNLAKGNRGAPLNVAPPPPANDEF